MQQAYCALVYQNRLLEWGTAVTIRRSHAFNREKYYIPDRNKKYRR